MARMASQIVAAVTDLVGRKGSANPAVRGAEAQSGVVTAVNAGGTVSVGTIRARRLESYQSPAVGDQALLVQGGSGNWWAAGRTSVTDTAWTDIPLAAGFTTPHSVFGVAQYRLIVLHGTPRVELRGSVDAPTALTAQANFSAALPVAIRPSVQRTWVVRRQYSLDTKGSIAMEITTGGVLSVFASPTPNTTSWFAFDGCHYDL